MGIALKLIDADFASVAVGQVTFVEHVPCTGLSLNETAPTFEKVGDTFQLIATKTPSDTTDVLVWSSSNENIATVSTTGLITIHGLGSVTITATCGNQTATASIVQSTIKARGTLKFVEDYAVGNNSNILSFGSQTTGQYSIGNVYTGEEKLRIRYGNSRDMECVPVPYGATKMKMATQNGTSMSLNYFFVADMNDIVTIDSITYPKYLSSTNWVSSSSGGTVEYGQCVAIRIDTSKYTDTPTYFYFT